MKKTLVCALALLLIAGAAGTYFFLKNGIEKQVRPEIDRIAQDMRSQGVNASYKDMSVNVLARSVSLSDVTLDIDGQTMTIDQAVIFASPDYDREGRFQLRGMNLGRENLAALSRDPQSLPEHVKGDMEIDYALDPAASRVNIRRLSMGVRELGLLDLSLDVEGVPENAFQGDLTALLMGYPSLALRSLRLRYEDAGFVRIALADSAKEEGITPNEALKKAQDELDAQIEDAKAKNQPFAVEFLKAMKGFLNSQKGFEITAAPEKPVSAASLLGLADPKEAIKLLGLRAESL
mgnify:CR=1 FL=1